MNYETAIHEAARASYDDDAFYAVGRDGDLCSWSYRHIEDPQSALMLDAVRVGADGIQPEWEDQHRQNLQQEMAS